MFGKGGSIIIKCGCGCNNKFALTRWTNAGGGKSYAVEGGKDFQRCKCKKCGINININNFNAHTGR